MTPAELHQRNELDRDILTYVREAVRLAPVTLDAIEGFITTIRRRSVVRADIVDRLRYLASAGYLELHTEWAGGEFTHYTVTADGMDVLDGVKPPRNWQGK
jgi:hypothetical protein